MESEKIKGKEALKEHQQESWSVDPIDKLNHMVAWLDALSDLIERPHGHTVNLSPNGTDGFNLILMHIGEQVKEATDNLYKMFKVVNKSQENRT